MRVTLRSVLWSLGIASVGLVAGAGLFAPAVASAGNPVAVIVLKEHGVGTATQAQPYLTKFIGIAAQQNGWDPASKGQYETTRAGADTWIKAESPHYGIFSLAAFLAYRKQYNLDPIGSATMSTGGGQQYFVVSKTASSLAECKGKKLATDHDDQTFVEKVVAAGAFKLADFTVDPTKRFAQAGTKVVNGDADCALIDDAQLAQVATLPGGGAVKSVWSSDKMPPMVIAAFPSAPAAEKAAFQASLPNICQGGGQQTCSQVGLQTLSTANAQTYAKVVGLYP